MPRNAWMTWTAAVGVAVSAARAQEDLGPPRPPLRKVAPPAPTDIDLPAPKKPAAAASDSKHGTIDIPGVDLPDDGPPPRTTKEPTRFASKSASPAVVDLPEPSKPTTKSLGASAANPLPDRIAMPSAEDQKKPAPRTLDAPAKQTATPLATSQDAPNITISEPIPAQSTRPRKKPESPVLAQPVPMPQENAIPAPESKSTKNGPPIAESLSPTLRHAPKKSTDIVKTKAEAPADEVVQAAAFSPEPKPQDRYELVQPRLPSFDVVRARNAPRGDADAIATVYETPDQLGGGDVIQAGGTVGDDGRSTVESYAVKIWKIDGWETFAELARMEYRDEALAGPLAKYNRSSFRPSDGLPAGQKVRLPPKWVLDRSGKTVARRPAPIKSDFNAPPATAVQGQPAGTGMVASSGRAKPGGLVRDAAASPLPNDRTPVPDDGKVFVVNEKDMTLYKVAKKVLGNGSEWKRIYDLNRDRLSSSQAELKVGTRLRLPDESLLR